MVFHAIDLPDKKLGTIYCLNRPTSIYHIVSPQFDKTKFDSPEHYMVRVNPEGEYMAMQPSFSKDYTQLVYIGRDEKFLSHTGCYQLKLLEWPLEKPESKTILGIQKEYPADD